MALEKVRQCTTCDAKKTKDNFYFDIHKGDYRSQCKTCILVARKKYREKHKDVVYAYNREYLKTYNPKTGAQHCS